MNNAEPSLHYLYIMLGFVWVCALLDIFLRFLQFYLVSVTTAVPDFLDGLYPADAFNTARQFALEKLLFSIVSRICALAAHTVILYLWLFRTLWTWSILVAEALGLTLQIAGIITSHFDISENFIIGSIWIFLAWIIAILAIVPFQLFCKFGIEARYYGMNGEGIGSYLVRSLSYFTGLLIRLFLTNFAWTELPNSKHYSHLQTILLILFLGISLGVSSVRLIFPAELSPISISALPKGPLRENIDDVATQLNVTLNQMYKATSFDLNYKPPIIRQLCCTYSLYIQDTLMSRLTTDEMSAVAAREIYQWAKYRSVAYYVYLFLWIILRVLFAIFCLLGLRPTIYRTFGFAEDSKPFLIVDVLVHWYYAFIIIDYVIWLGTLWTYKLYQSAADDFVALSDRSENLSSAFVKIYSQWFMFPVENALYNYLVSEWPQLQQRLVKLQP